MIPGMAGAVAGMTSQGRRTGSAQLVGGSNIGTLTQAGGLAAMFDGNTNQGFTSVANLVSNGAGYGGWTITKAIDKAEVWPSNDSGFNGGTPTSVTLSLYTKTGAAPANLTDGTLQATTTIADTTTGPVTLTTPDAVTFTNYDHVWIALTASGGDTRAIIAEAKFYGW